MRLAISVPRRCFSSLSRLLNETKATDIPRIDPYSTLPTTSYTVDTVDVTPQTNAEVDGIKFSVGKPDELGLEKAHMTMKQYFQGDSHHSHKVFSGQQANFKQGQKVEQRTFVDLRLIRLQSGAGGNGCVSFFRDANRPVGPPDGGDGGIGGNIYVQVVNNISLLHKVRRTYVAGNGKPGTASQLDGKSGLDVILEVPVGTTMRWIPDPVEVREQLRAADDDIGKVRMGVHVTGKNDIQLMRGDYVPGEGWHYKEKSEEYHLERQFFNELNEQVKEYDREVIAEELVFDRFPLGGLDFSEPTDKPMLVMRGGKGGMGNMHFLTQNVRNPRFSKRGRKGLDAHFILELKLIADLGLVGLPNAGKLTLLRAISAARPRVGHWEFTTLQPTIGTIFTSIDRDPFTVADIPGIIRDASENRGMGMDFLRHIERSGGLVFVVSLESASPVADLCLLKEEIGARRMHGKQVMVIATKADLVNDAGRFHELREFVGAQEGWRCVPVCAPRGENIDECIRMMGDIAAATKRT